MPRYCFQLQVKPERIAEYRERHAAVWPEMLRALAETGWHNYSLFLRPDGLLIGYVESDDLAAAQAAMDATDVNPRWQAEMGQFFEALDVPPDQGFVLLEEVFHLEDQLAALDRLHHKGDHDDDRLRRHHRPAREPGHRGPLVGLRQLRHPVQGVRLPRHAAHRRGEDRRRRDRAPVHRAGPVASRCTSRGTWSTTTPSSRRTPRTTASPSAPSTPTPSRTTTTSSAA